MLQRLNIPMIAALVVASAGLLMTQMGFAQSTQAESSRRVCTQQYDPVCARRGTSYRTFGNACEAQVAGYVVKDKGRCDLAQDDHGYNDPPVLCTREYDPVCGIGRKGEKTFSNACQAQAAGYRIVHGGRC